MIRPNKRWLARRRKELLAAHSVGFFEESSWQLELQAVELSIVAMSTPEGAANFKKEYRAAKKQRIGKVRISVVGEAKQGKTSFMNAALDSPPIGAGLTGGLILAIKPEDAALWDMYAESAGRAQDIVLMHSPDEIRLQDATKGLSITDEFSAVKAYGDAPKDRSQRKTVEPEPKPLNP